MGDNQPERRPDSFLNSFWHPSPRPPAFGKGKVIPQASAGCVNVRPTSASGLQQFTDHKMDPYQAVVASRTLMAVAVDHGGLYEALGSRW
jgi:hypothetical protein